MKAKPIQIEALRKQLTEQYHVVLLFGSDFGVVSDCAEKIIQIILPKKDDFSLIKVSKTQLKEHPSLLIDEANTVSFWTDRRIIWLKDADNNQTNAVESFLENIQTNTVLLITTENLMKNASLRVLCENHADALAIACYEDSESDMRFLIKEYLKLNNYYCSTEVLDVLVTRCNENRLITKNELTKLLTYVGENKEITVSDVENIIPDLKNSTLENLCFCVAGGDQKQADKATKILLDNNEIPVTIVRTLSQYFNKLLIGKDLLLKKTGSDVIFKKLLRANQYMFKETFLNQLQLWNKELLLKTLLLLNETEEQIKSTGTPGEVVLHRTITAISGLARKLKRQSF